MIRTLALVATLALPASASAQGACPAGLEDREIDPCLVGLWLGQSDGHERARAAIEAMGMGDIGVVPDPPPAIVMDIADTRGFVSMPIRSGTTAFISDDTGVSTLRLDVAIGMQSGQIWTDGGQFSWCGTSHATGTLGMDLTAPDGATGSVTMDLPADDGSFIPLTTYSCAGDQFVTTTIVGPPLGAIETVFRRIDPDDLDARDRDFLFGR